MTYHYDVVRSSGRQIVEAARKVGRGREVLRLRRIESEELLHVEELYSMVDALYFRVRGNVLIRLLGVANKPLSQSPCNSCTISFRARSN